MNGLQKEQASYLQGAFNKKPNTVRQTNFSGGEVDAVNFRRTDLSLYMSSAQSLLNCTVNTTQLVQKRNGSLQLANVTSYINGLSTVRMFPFIDRDGNYYPVMAVFNPLSSLTTLNIFDGSMNFIQALDVSAIALQSQFMQLNYSNVNDAVVFVQSAVSPFRLFTTYPINSSSFSIANLNIYPYPAYDFGQIDYNNFVVSFSGGTSTTFQFTGLSSDPGFNSEWIGGVIIGQGPSADTPLGYAIITDVSYSGGTTTFTIIVQLPFISSPPTQGSQYSIRQPAFSAELGYPEVVNYYQNRLFFANTKSLPLALFGSKVNEPTDFDVGIGNDADALIYTLGNTQSGPIVALNAGKQLEIYTEYLEYACPQDQNTALTPSTLSVRQQTAYGSKGNCKPISYDNDSYFISRTGNAIMQFHFEGIGLSYQSTNISLQSTHLVKNPSNRALIRGSGGSSTQTQDNFVYFLNPDNTITAFQFSETFSLAALTPISFQDNVKIIDIVSINNQLYLLKYYQINSQYIMEAFTDSVENDTVPLRLDNAIAATVDEDGVVTGLDNYIGYKVNVFLNNYDYGSYLVPATGTITVDNMQTTGNAYIGLVYPVVITPMFVYAGAIATNYYKNITKINVDYYQSLAFYVNNELVLYQNFLNIQKGIQLAPQSGTYSVDTVTGFNIDFTFNITQNNAFDLILSAIEYYIDADYI